MSGKPSRPSLIHPRLWLRRRAHYHAVIEEALRLLGQHEILWTDERNLVRELQFTTIAARRKLDPKGRFGSPCFEAQNPPDPDADREQPFELKRPDIQWRHDDETAKDDRHREKSFVIECKRLGAKTPAGWNLIEEYVVSGIARFVSPAWKYGHHMGEGMMIGFVQNMEPNEILGAINCHIASHQLSPLQLDEGFQMDGVSGLTHSLERTFPNSPFHLSHRWLDLRNVPLRQN